MSEGTDNQNSHCKASDEAIADDETQKLIVQEATVAVEEAKQKGDDIFAAAKAALAAAVEKQKKTHQARDAAVKAFEH